VVHGIWGNSIGNCLQEKEIFANFIEVMIFRGHQKIGTSRCPLEQVLAMRADSDGWYTA